jgi:hypothetical protein
MPRGRFARPSEQQVDVEEPELLEALGITPEEVKIETFRVAVQNHVNTTAKKRSYESSIALVSYLNDPNPVWSAEAAAFVAWRSEVWEYAFERLQEIKDGIGEEPENTDALIAELPLMIWPDQDEI